MESARYKGIHVQTLIIVGNGPSRGQINLWQYKRKGYVLYGCNRAYEDLVFDRLFCTDRGMTEEIVKSSYRGRIVVRPGNDEILDKRIEVFDADKIYRGERPKKETVASGTRALLYGIEKGYKNIYLLGFDLYDPGDKKLIRPSAVTNIYAGTKFYEVTRTSLRVETAKRFGAQIEKYYHLCRRVTTEKTASIDPKREISRNEFLSRAAAGLL